MPWFRWIFILCSAIVSASPSPAAESIAADHVKVSWIAPSQLTNAETTVGIRFEIEPHWHIYWKNPGDSGTAPKFKMQADQAELGAVAWPSPKRFLIGDLTNIGYETEVIFPFTIKPRVKSGDLTITADLEWLVCKEECLPGFGQLTLQRPLSKTPAAWDNKYRLDHFLAQVPSASSQSSWAIDSILRQNDELVVAIHSKSGAPLAMLEAFPVETNFLTPARPQVSNDGKALHFKIQGGQKTPATASFVLVDTGGSWLHEDLSLAPPTKPLDWPAFLILLLSAFAGGIILNLMPCVLPVLSIKFFSLAKVNAKTRWQEAMLYTLGVLVTFTALGGLFLGLRAGGAAIGWGFQLQSPPIVTALIVLFWMMGLSFLGFFEFGNSLTRAAGKFENTGAFATGCLSVFIATPCTGPFMGTALGAAAVMPALEALLIFFCLGLGLASPFMALALFPKIKLPRPGMWMVTLRQFLAFPLFGTVVWLLWVLGEQLGTDAWLYVSTLGLALSFCIWLAKERGILWKGVALLLALAALAYTGKWVIKAPMVAGRDAAASGATAWVDYDAQLIAEAKTEGRPVFVDFTAAWCVTCQLNKKAVLETKAAEKIFTEQNVKLIKGDWTNLDPKITEALAAFERASVPLYLFYPADGSRPRILPQILTLSDIESLFQK